MIEIYNQDNTNYEFNGDQTLFPSLCDASAEINGAWQLELRHPIDDDGRYKSIAENAVVKVPSFNGNQLFRVYEKVATNYEVAAYAYPIFLDARDEVMLIDCRPTLLNGQGALDWMLDGFSKYSGESDITKVETAYYIRKNFFEAIAGDNENTFLNRWGGEIYYDNYNIIINEHVGSDRGVSVIYGKNLSAIEEDIDTSEIITRIIPEAYNGYMLDGDEPWVDSDLIDVYPKIYSRVVYFDDVKMIDDATEDEPGYETIEELRAELVRRCELMYSQDHVDKPKVSIDVEMIQLSQTEEYKDYIMLEDVALGDTIRVIHNKFGIESEARVVALTYDCIGRKNKSVTIGVERNNIMDSISDTKSKIDSVVSDKTGDIRAEKVSGILNALKAKMRAQNSVAQRQDVIAILFEDTDPDSATFGALGIGTKGITIADSKIAGGTDWDWKLAIDARSIYAGAIITGILTDKLGRNSWNLDSGVLTISDSMRIIAGDTDAAFSEIITNLSSATGDVAANLEAIIAERSQVFEDNLSVIAQQIADIAATAERISFEFINRITGGYNLIHNSSGLNGINGWTKSGAGTAVGNQTQEVKNNTVAKSMIVIDNAEISQNIEVLQGQEYTFCCKAKRNTAYSCYLKIQNDDEELIVFNEQSTSNWSDFELRLTAKTTSVTITAGSTGESGNDLYVADMIIVQGAYKQYWSPAAYEVYSSLTTIDGTGVHVRGSDDNVETMVGDTGFHILYDEDPNDDVDEKTIALTFNRDLSKLSRTQINKDLTVGKLRTIPVDGGVDIVLLD